MEFTQTGGKRIANQDFFHQRMKGAIAWGQMLTEKTGGELNGDKPMPLAGLSPRPQFIFSGRVESRRQRFHICRAPPAANGTMPIQIEAKLQAAGMKTPRPFELGLGIQFKIVPLDADPQFMEISVKLLPAFLKTSPNRRLAEWQDVCLPPFRFAPPGYS